MARFISFTNKLTDVVGRAVGWLVPAMILLTLFEVFMRYVLDRPPVIADEFSSYMLIAISFLGLAFTWKAGEHVRITALVEHIPHKISVRFRLATLVLALVVDIALIFSGYVFLSNSFRIGERSLTWLRTPLQWPQMTLILGFIVVALFLLAQILGAILAHWSGREVNR